MAVAKPKVQALKSAGYTGAGGTHTSELGQALGNVAGALRRRAEKREKAEEKEHKRKTELLTLQARNKWYDWREEQQNSGAWDGLSAAEVEQASEDEMERLVAPLLRHDEVAAEDFRLKTRQSTAEATAKVREREDKEAEAEVVAAYAETEMRFKSEIGGLMRTAMTAKSERERNAAFHEAQSQYNDAMAEYDTLPAEEREKHAGKLMGVMNEARFDGAVWHAVETGTVNEFFSRVRNNTDWVDEAAGTRFSQGVSSARLMEAQRQALAEVARRDKAAAQALDNAKKRQQAEQEDYYEQVEDDVAAGRITIEQGRTRLRETGDETGRGKLTQWWLDEQDDDGKLSEHSLNGDKFARGFTESVSFEITTLDDNRLVRRKRQQARMMYRDGQISQEQRDTILDMAQEQIAYNDEVEDSWNADQRDLRRQVNQAWQGVTAGAGLIGESIIVTEPNQKELAFYARLKRPVTEFLLAENADGTQIDLVIGELLPALWASQGQTVMDTIEGRQLPGEDVFAAEQQPAGFGKSRQEQGVRDLERALGALSRSGVVIENHKEWLSVALKPEVGAHVRYHETATANAGAGDVNRAQTILSLERTYGSEGAAQVYENVIEPMMRMARSLNGRRSNLEVAEDTKKWVEHWRPTE